MTDGVEPQRYFMVRGKRYDFPAELTGREFRFIKQETGVRAGEIGDELASGDADLLICLAVVSMRRSGEDAKPEDLLDLPIGGEGGIEFMEDDEPRPTRAAEGGEGAEVKDLQAAKPGRRRSSASTA